MCEMLEVFFHPPKMSQSVKFTDIYPNPKLTKTAGSAVQEKGRHPWMRPFPLPSHSSHWGVRYWKFVWPTTPPQMSQSVLQYRQAVRTTPLPYASPSITFGWVRYWEFVSPTTLKEGTPYHGTRLPCYVVCICVTVWDTESLFYPRQMSQSVTHTYRKDTSMCHPIHHTVVSCCRSLFHPLFKCQTSLTVRFTAKNGMQPCWGWH